jgi:hypothetical protein
VALRQPKPEPSDPRLKGHETTYSSSRGGWVKPADKPVPGTPKMIGIAYSVDLDPQAAERLADLHGLTVDQLRRGIAYLESGKPLAEG